MRVYQFRHVGTDVASTCTTKNTYFKLKRRNLETITAQ
jgi:hypothetical protein